MKKIALLHYTYSPHIGGVEHMLQTHAEILTELGFPVTIIVGNGKSTNPSIPVIEIPELQSILSFNPSLFEKVTQKGVFDDEYHALKKLIYSKLENALKDQDVIIIHNVLTLQHNLAFVEAFHEYVASHPKQQIFAWTHDHNFITEEKIKDTMTASISEHERTLLSTVLPNATYIVISETFKKLLQQVMRLPEDHTFVIHNGIKIDDFVEIEPRIQALVNKYSLLHGFPTILSPVNILERKNLEYCIEIVSHLREKFPSIRYIISGKPSKHRNTASYFDFLKETVRKFNLEDNVIFLTDEIQDELKSSEIHDIYSIADLVFFFSKTENFGLPIIEAFATKTPIFTSDLAIFEEVGQGFAHKIDFKTESAQEAAEKIKTFIEGDTQIQASFHVRKNYDLTTILSKKLLPLLDK